MPISWVHGLEGGILIGLAVSLMLLWNGRVTGISGILYGLLNPVRGDIAWRFFFVLGLLAGGAVLLVLQAPVFNFPDFPSRAGLQIAGVLVGFGTVLGGGCTSGHGVCGISRLSIRSLVATALFMAAGILAVWVFRSWGVLP